MPQAEFGGDFFCRWRVWSHRGTPDHPQLQGHHRSTESHRCHTFHHHQGADLITFTSSSTVDHFFALGLDWPEGCVAGSIGPVTSETLRKHGTPPAFEASPHDIPGLVAAIVRYFKKH